MILAYVYLKNPNALLDPEFVRKTVDDYVKSSPLIHPGHLTTVRDAILGRLDELLYAYQRLEHIEEIL